jgi:hypothetical protein
MMLVKDKSLLRKYGLLSFRFGEDAEEFSIDDLNIDHRSF